LCYSLPKDRRNTTFQLTAHLVLPLSCQNTWGALPIEEGAIPQPGFQENRTGVFQRLMELLFHPLTFSEVIIYLSPRMSTTWGEISRVSCSRSQGPHSLNLEDPCYLKENPGNTSRDVTGTFHHPPLHPDEDTSCEARLVVAVQGTSKVLSPLGKLKVRRGLAFLQKDKTIPRIRSPGNLWTGKPQAPLNHHPFPHPCRKLRKRNSRNGLPGSTPKECRSESQHKEDNPARNPSCPFPSSENQGVREGVAPYTLSNWSLPTPQIGQTQVSGRSAKRVPAGIPESGSPKTGIVNIATDLATVPLNLPRLCLFFLVRCCFTGNFTAFHVPVVRVGHGNG